MLIKWLCRLTSALDFHAERSSNGYASHHLGTVVGQSGHLLWASAPLGQPSLVPPDEKAAVRRICVATRSKTLSAGHLVVHFVTGQMVGDRQCPGRQYLGASRTTFTVNHPVSVPPTGCVHRDAFWCGQCTRWQVLYVRTGSLSGLQFTTLRRLCGQLVRQQQKGQHPEGGCWSAVSGEQEAEGR